MAVYRGTQGIRSGGRLHRVYSDGRREPLPGFTGEHYFPTLSPDGKKIAIVKRPGGDSQLWVFDVTTGTGTRLAYGHSRHGLPRWTPDGKRILYSEPGEGAIYWTRADGSGKPVKLLEHKGGVSVIGMTPDGNTLLYRNAPAGCSAVSVEGDPERPTVGSPANCFDVERVSQAELSPDGKWIAYGSTTQGNQDDIYVRAYPGSGGKWQVTMNGGTRPAWSPATRELFFISPKEELMAVLYRVSGNSFSVGTPRRWTTPNLLGSERNYSIAPDGKSIVVVTDESSREMEPHVSVLLNFFDEVRRRVEGDEP